jgi:hypothetical protein
MGAIDLPDFMVPKQSADKDQASELKDISQVPDGEIGVATLLHELFDEGIDTRNTLPAGVGILLVCCCYMALTAVLWLITYPIRANVYGEIS